MPGPYRSWGPGPDAGPVGLLAVSESIIWSRLYSLPPSAAMREILKRWHLLSRNRRANPNRASCEAAGLVVY